MDIGNLAGAEQVLADVLRKVEGLDDSLSRARALWAQSRLRTMENDAEGAIVYAERALEILEVSDQDYYAALAHQLLAHIELDRGNGERAAALLEQAAPMIARSGRPFEAASFRIEQARALLAAGRRDEAASVALAASAAMTELSSVDAGRSYAIVADVFLELEEEERALELLELAIEHLAATPNRYLVDAYRKLGELLERRGDHVAALEIYKRGMQVQVEAERSLLPPG
jgi:tetratricopeptide (TPR) repeat protein